MQTPPDGSLIYDREDAISFAANQTGFTRETVEGILRASDLYEIGAGIMSPIGEENPEEDPKTIRAAAPDLFPPTAASERFLNVTKQAEYIGRTTGLAPEIVGAVQRADFDYMVQQGIVEGE